MRICKCNKCGKNVSEEEVVGWEFSCPYGSIFDSDQIRVDLCPDCLDDEIMRMEKEWNLPVRTEWL